MLSNYNLNVVKNRWVQMWFWISIYIWATLLIWITYPFHIFIFLYWSVKTWKFKEWWMLNYVMKKDRSCKDDIDSLKNLFTENKWSNLHKNDWNGN